MAGVHAHKSPSGAKRLHGCAGALALVATLPPEMQSTGGAAARRGTAAHFLMEVCLSEGAPPEAYAGRLIQITLDDSGNEAGAEMLKKRAKLPKDPEARARTFEVDSEMIENVDVAFSYVTARCEALGVALDTLQLETRTNPVPDRDDTSGTADITIDAWPTVLEVVDYKNGRITVEHEDNPQVLAYLAGRAHDTGWMHDSYVVTIVQPNGRHEEGEVRTFEITPDELLAFVDKHRTAAERADAAADALEALDGDPEARLALGAKWADTFLAAGDHCTFCEATHICPAAKAARRAQAMTDFDTPVDELPAPLVEAHAEAVAILERAPHMQAMIRAAANFVHNEARHGRMPAGLKFVRKRSYRRWIDTDPPEILADKIVAAGYLNANEKALLMKPAALITGPQAEKLVPRDKRKDFAAEFLHKPEGGLKIVLESDPGEAVEVQPGQDFDDFDGGETWGE